MARITSNNPNIQSASENTTTRYHNQPATTNIQCSLLSNLPLITANQ